MTDACKAALSTLEAKDVQSVVWMTKMLQTLTNNVQQMPGSL